MPYVSGRCNSLRLPPSYGKFVFWRDSKISVKLGCTVCMGFNVSSHHCMWSHLFFKSIHTFQLQNKSKCVEVDTKIFCACLTLHVCGIHCFTDFLNERKCAEFIQYRRSHLRTLILWAKILDVSGCSLVFLMPRHRSIKQVTDTS